MIGKVVVVVFRLSYMSPRGDVFSLTDTSRNRVQLDEGGIDGLVATVEDVTVTADTAAGQVFDSLRVKPMTGSLKVSIIASSPAARMELYRRWRAAWSRATPGCVIVDSDSGVRVSARLRLSDVLPPPETTPENTDAISMVVPVVCDEGVWRMEIFHGTGAVSVYNPGDITVYPSIVWTGGGIITLPSGATVTLPVVDTGARRHLLLDDHESCAIVDDHGVLDRSLWPLPGVMAEGVPPGQSRVFTVFSGAEVRWQPRVFDPWR